MALAVAINQTLIFNFDYKAITLNLLIPFLIFIVFKSKDATNIQFLIYGIIVGLISLNYQAGEYQIYKVDIWLT
jgi:hypothetical protein